MNVATVLLDLLKRKGSVKVPQFGTFYTENAKAILHTESGVFLPPAKIILFNADENTTDEELLEIQASTKNSPLENTNFELQTQVDYWKKMLKNQQNFTVEGIGEFTFSEGILKFKGNRIIAESPDFYGLEEVHISALTAKNANEESTKTLESYRFNNSILWVFLVLIPVAGIIYLSITQKDIIFGKKSFDFSVKTSTHRIEKKIPAEVDSVKRVVQDTIPIQNKVDAKPSKK